MLAALAGGEAMTAGEVAAKAGLARADRVDDAVEARQERRGAEGRARLPARVRPDRDTVLARRVASLAARRWTADLRRRTLRGDGTPPQLHLPALPRGADLGQHQRDRERQPAPGGAPREERRARPRARPRRVLALALEVAPPRLRRPTRSAIAAASANPVRALRRARPARSSSTNASMLASASAANSRSWPSSSASSNRRLRLSHSCWLHIRRSYARGDRAP